MQATMQTSLVAQTVKRLSTVRETHVRAEAKGEAEKQQLGAFGALSTALKRYVSLQT